MSSLSNVDFKNLVGSKKRKLKLPSSTAARLSAEVQRELELDAQSERRRKARKPRKPTAQSPSNAAPEPSGAGRGQPLGPHASGSTAAKAAPYVGRPKYRDRAQERRSGKSDFEEMRGEIAPEYTKFLGGDASNTHMVKGLDLQLMRKTIRQKNLDKAKVAAESEAIRAPSLELIGPGESRAEEAGGEGMPLVKSDYARRVFVAMTNPNHELAVMKKSRPLKFAELPVVEYRVEAQTCGDLPKEIGNLSVFAQAASKYDDTMMNPLDDAVLSTVKNAYVSIRTRESHALAKEKEKQNERKNGWESSSDDDDDIFSDAGNEYSVDYDAVAKRQEEAEEAQAKEEAVTLLENAAAAAGKTQASSKALWDEFDEAQEKSEQEQAALPAPQSESQPKPKTKPEKSSKDLWGEFEAEDDN